MKVPAVIDDERQQVLDPLRGRPVEEAAVAGCESTRDVGDAPDLPWIAAGPDRCRVDGAAGGGQVRQTGVAAWDDPAVGEPAGEVEHAGASAHPDRDVVGGRRAAVDAVDTVVGSLGARSALARRPDAANDVDGLLERIDRGTGRGDRCPSTPWHDSRRERSSSRPCDSRSRLAAALARTAGCRIGTLMTLGASRIRSVCPATQLSSVHVS